MLIAPFFFAVENYPYPVHDKEEATTQTSSSTEKESTVSVEKNVIADSVDNDAVVVINEEKSGTVDKNDDDYYEYYYVYYDEQGNIVNNATQPKDTAALQSENKVQEIKIEPPSAPTSAVAHNSVVTRDKTPGDTPTIYAEIQNPDQQHSIDESEDEDEGLSIFGIPIPKIPISLSFGLAPALSQGLLPLPIGRKGDTDSSSDLVTSGSDNDVVKSKLPSVVNNDQTRGPDGIDPIWIETGLKAASNILPSLMTSLAGSGGSSDTGSEREGVTNKREIAKTAAGNGNNHQMYNYQHPQNPIIPLSQHHQKHHQKYFPSSGAGAESDYFPKGYIPAIKFDHPIHGRPGPLPGGGSPVLPPPSVSHENIHPPPKIAFNEYPESDLREGGHVGSPKHTVNGFRPLFRPNKVDPMYGSKDVIETVAFPGLEPTGSVVLPPGFKTPATFSTEANRYPPLKSPSITFSSPATNDIEQSTEEEEEASVGPSYEAVPNYYDTTQERPNLALPSEPVPTLADLFPSQTPTEEAYEDTRQGEEGQEEYEYYEEVPEYDRTGVVERDGQSEIEKLLQELRLQQQQQQQSTDRVVPTLEVEEITEKSGPVTSTNRIDSTLGSLLDNVAVTHRGSPKEDPEMTTPESTTFLEKESSTTTTTTEGNPEAAKEDEYEYEYYYEYYEEDEDTTDKNAESSTAPTSTLGSIFELMHQQQTEPPPIRTSTQLYDGSNNGNFLESQRSSVTVESVSASRIQAFPSSSPRSNDRQATARSSSPYPFHPDRLDPGAPPKGGSDNTVNWYYSSYNGDGQNKPYVGPGKEEVLGRRRGVRNAATSEVKVNTWVLGSLATALVFLII